MSSERWIRPEVRIVLCRCQATRKLFGQRLEQTAPSTWTATWAFKISEGNAKQEGYESVSLTGQFQLGADYPGCPECQAMSCFGCKCGQLTCYDGESRVSTCAWCHITAELGGTLSSVVSKTDA